LEFRIWGAGHGSGGEKALHGGVGESFSNRKSFFRVVNYSAHLGKEKVPQQGVEVNYHCDF